MCTCRLCGVECGDIHTVNARMTICAGTGYTPENLEIPIREIILLDGAGREGGGELLQRCSASAALSGLHLRPLGQVGGGADNAKEEGSSRDGLAPRPAVGHHCVAILLAAQGRSGKGEGMGTLGNTY